MKKLAKTLAVVLVLVILASSFTTCFTRFGIETEMPFVYYIFSVPVDIIFFPITIPLAFLAGSSETDTQIYMAGFDLSSEEYSSLMGKINSLPRSEIYSLMQTIKSIPEAEISATREMLNSIPEEKIIALVKGCNSLPQTEIADSIKRLNDMTTEELVSILQTFYSLSEADIDELIESFNSIPQTENVVLIYWKETDIAVTSMKV